MTIEQRRQLDEEIDAIAQQYKELITEQHATDRRLFWERVAASAACSPVMAELQMSDLAAVCAQIADALTAEWESRFIAKEK